MRKSLLLLILTTIGFCSCVQNDKSTPNKVTIDLEKEDSIKKRKLQTYNPNKHIDTQYKHVDTTGKNIRIQNSLPKGGGDIDGERGYTDFAGKNYAYAIFWTRVINETAKPLKLKVNFPANSFAIFTSADAYLKLFLPSDTMTLDKQPLYNYGITGLKSFLDTNFNKPTILHRTINPNEEYIFYVAALTYKAAGWPRAGLVLKEQDLYYKISIDPHGSALIPCGQMLVKN